MTAEEQLIHDICVFEERIIDYRSRQNPPDAIEIAKLEIRQKRAVEMYKEDICKKAFNDARKLKHYPKQTYKSISTAEPKYNSFKDWLNEKGNNTNTRNSNRTG